MGEKFSIGHIGGMQGPGIVKGMGAGMRMRARAYGCTYGPGHVRLRLPACLPGRMDSGRDRPS